MIIQEESKGAQNAIKEKFKDLTKESMAEIDEKNQIKLVAQELSANTIKVS